MISESSSDVWPPLYPKPQNIPGAMFLRLQATDFAVIMSQKLCSQKFQHASISTFLLLLAA